ncbi:MAG: ComF family protein [Rudaea sp.]|nr:ComF family protein [Rudaea sp.]
MANSLGADDASLDTANVAVNLNERLRVDGLWGALQFAVLPPRCLLCGGRGDGARDLCAACAADLAHNRLCCPRCALPLQTPALRCGECLKNMPPFFAASAPFVYGHPLDLLMARLKFGQSLAAGRVLSEMWLGALRESMPAKPSALLPVPLHASRLRERGYNQALELARPLARALEIPVLHAALQRTRATPAQVNLDAKVRRRNLQGAFAVVENVALPAHVALVDDVMTTGATLRECARVLLRAGVERVDVWALARAPRLR